MPLVTYHVAQTDFDFEQGKQLFIEYTQSLGIDLTFQNVDAEFKAIAKKYYHPEGALILAYVTDANSRQLAGCVAVRRFEQTTAELKRLYIKPTFRGHKIAKGLIKLALEQTKSLGYKKIYLDTLSTMQAAYSLYLQSGFYEIKAYYHNPLDNVIYMEKMIR